MDKKVKIHFKYANTDIQPKIGDTVKFVGEGEEMVVVDIINTVQKRKEWGVDKNMIVMKGDKYGYISDQLTKQSEVVFIARAR